LKGKVKNRRPEEQVESTIQLIKNNHSFMIPESAKILKIVKVRSSSPKMNKKKSDILYISNDNKIAKVIRG